MDQTWQQLLAAYGNQHPVVQAVVGLAVLITAVLLLHLIARPLVVRVVATIIERSTVSWDDTFVEKRVPHRLSLLIPLIALRAGLPLVEGIPLALTVLLQRIVGSLMILVVALTIDAIMSAGQAMYSRTPAATTRPIRSYVQLAKIILYLIAGIFIVARLADQSPWYFVSGLGAMMAIILIIFRDTLLSLVASVQLTSNDLVRVDDWIEMPQFGADGDVLDISLTSVTIKNWDSTTSVVPTHKFLDNSFKNWRGMFERGGRRIKRAIHVNMSGVRFLEPEEVEHFRRFVLLREYIDSKLTELEEYNAPYADDPEAIVNARRLTNIGMLRAYIIAYLRNHPMIHQQMTFLVRQLAPTPEGLPLEIYVFTKDTRWAVYEGVQADVFDHILAIIDQFDLKVYQRPSGDDLAGLLAVAD